MGKKSRAKRKDKKLKLKPKDYEGYRYGPLKLERFGRYVRIRSDWKSGEFKKHIDYVRKKRPEHKKEIDNKIAQLISLINTYEPFELLSTLSFKNCFTDPEKYRETTHEGRECYVEYALSLILSQKHRQNLPHATSEAIEQFNTLISDIINSVLWYFGSEITEGKHDELKEELRFFSILRFLFVRGDSFPEHHLELIQDIFKEHDEFLSRHCGFTSSQILEGIRQIEERLLNNIQEQIQHLSILRELHEIFKEFVEKEGAGSFTSMEDLRSKYLSLPSVKEKEKELNKSHQAIQNIPFEIIPNAKAPVQLLDLLSSRFGDNVAFADFEKSPAWPTNDSIIFERPLIKDGGKYYCFMPQLLFRNIGNILEKWIQQADNGYFENVYSKKRGALLEKKALEYLGKILPGAVIYNKLFYPVVENGKPIRAETDGLVLYDENIIVVESKAGSLSLSAKRGGLERMRRDISELVDNAYAQATRTKQYILDADVPVFEYEDGSKAFEIRDKSQYRNIYLFNITLANLAHIAARLHSLKAFNFIQGKEWPWSVFINDLRIISDLIEFPSQFLHFLQRRIRANDYPQFRAADELDFFMFYINEGLYFEDGVLKNINSFTPHGYTESLDRYYDYIAGRVSSGEKPTYNIPGDYRKLIAEIEATAKHGFTRVSTTLLSFDWNVQRQIIESLAKLQSEVEQDGRSHDMTMLLNDEKTGIIFSVSGPRTQAYLEKLERHCNFKMYQTHYEEWILVTLEIHNGKNTTDFQVYNKKWEYDPVMEEYLKRFKEWKLTQFQKTGQKIGRNDSCPCNSGLKYKKCCGK
ncbi:MAG: SEC-C metal-binding domain-containing protein [Thermodesulfobacteriota bacterium]